MHINTRRPDIVAVIPCYNEQETIKTVVSKAFKYVPQVIVVDDGSNDQTAKEAQMAGAIVLAHPYNQGKGAAIKTAFLHLRTLGCIAAVLLDGDGQHDPAEIPRVLAPVLSGDADIVVGSRFIEGSYLIPLHRRISQIVLNVVTYIGSHVWVSDSQSGFRSFSRYAIGIMEFQGKGFSIESEMQFIAARHGLKIKEVPISTIYGGRAKRNLFLQGLDVLFGVFSLVFGAKDFSNGTGQPENKRNIPS
ncbi:MAG: glycosyltransferase family 2 protein [bacterium]|jgi:glycosyltransferase involved in cell wall biosynthesis